MTGPVADTSCKCDCVRGGVLEFTPITLSQSCTIRFPCHSLSFVSELLCALDKSSNTLVLAQACREKHSAFAHVHNRKEIFLTVSNKIQRKLACIPEANESTRMRMENSIPQNHEDHIAGKGENSLQHYNLVHKFIPMPQAVKIPAAKAAVDKEWEKLEKISVWNVTKVKSKKSVIDEARTTGATVHFASLMDICYLKNAELEAQHQKYKGRVVLRGDIVKDDSGSYAVFSEQGSSASQMTAAKIMDIISRLPGCDGQAADAVSAYTQVKMEDAHKLLKIPKSECPDIWIRLPRHKWPKSWSSMEDPVVLLERNLYGHPLAGLLWERHFEKILLKHGWEKIPNWECLFVHREKGLFLSVYVDDIKLAGKKQNLDPMWKVLNKEVDLGEPTSFLDHLYLGCTQRKCEISKISVDNYRTMFESRIFAVGSEKLPFPQNLRISSWSYDMAGHAKKCVEQYCELANKTTQQLYKVSTPCIDDHHFKEEEMKSVGELSNVCSQIVLKCLNLARIGRPDILWSVSKLARSITKWTKACDKRLREILRTQNPLLEEHFVFLEFIRLFKSVGCVRNKHQFRTAQQNPRSYLWTRD